jgi:hypothetical protein
VRDGNKSPHKIREFAEITLLILGGRDEQAYRYNNRATKDNPLNVW